MTTLTDLHRSVQTTIAGKRVGTPVFVRYQLYSRDRGQAVTARLTRIVAVVQGWFDQRLERIYGLGDAKSGQITLALEFAGGATALVTWARSQAQGDGVDLMLLGNHGAIYHDAGAAALWDEPAAPLAGEPDKQIAALIQRALRSEQPITARGNGN